MRELPPPHESWRQHDAPRELWRQHNALHSSKSWGWTAPWYDTEDHDAWEQGHELGWTTSRADGHSAHKDWDACDSWQGRGYNYSWPRREIRPRADSISQAESHESSVQDPGVATSIAALVQLTEAPEEEQKWLKESHLVDLLAGLQKQVRCSITVSPGQLLTILRPLVTLGFKDKPLLDAISAQVIWKIDEFDPAGLAQLAETFATLDFPQHQLMVTIAVEATRQIKHFDVRHLAGTAWGFAVLRLRHGRLMRAIAQEAVLKITEFDDEDLARVAWAFATLDLAPPELTTLLVAKASKHAAGTCTSQISAIAPATYPASSGPPRVSSSTRGGQRRSSTARACSAPERKAAKSVIKRSHSADTDMRSADVERASPADRDDACSARARSAAWSSAQIDTAWPRCDLTAARDTAASRSGSARWVCLKCSFSNSGLLPYCEECQAPRSSANRASADADASSKKLAGMEEHEFPTVGATRKTQPEFKRLPPPGRLSQKQRKQKAVEAATLRREGRPDSDAEEKVCGDEQSWRTNASAAGRATEDDSDDDFENSTLSMGYDLLDEALGDDDDAPSYNALLESLRSQLRKQHGGQLAERLTDQQVLTKAEGLSTSKEDQEHLLKFLEARRLAEKVAQGRHRSKSAQKKKALQEKKLERDYVKREIKNAYTAEFNNTVRYYNSVAIKVHKGEKSVDAKTIATVTAAQEGRMEEKQEKLTKEERSMIRRCA